MAERCAEIPEWTQCFMPFRFTAAVRSCVITTAIMLTGTTLAADATCEHSANSGGKQAPDELAEIIVVGETLKTGTKDLQAWLRRLVGRFNFKGHVDLCGSREASDLRPVTGSASCIGAGSTPSVFCSINVDWAETTTSGGESLPSAASRLRPALVVYTLENRYIPDKRIHRPGLVFTQVDNQGVAEWASGILAGDTFISMEPCVEIPGACEKVTRITARPDSNEISMHLVIRVDGRSVQSHSLVLHREANARTGAQSMESPP